ncbi:MAG: HAD family phosphatase [Tissierellia bacterium]|nr:HAD family phosphatase [Tissierellia bacterium]
MFKDIEALIFDFDGTLVDSLRLWYEVDVEFLALRGIRCPDDLQRDIEGMGLNDCAIYFKRRFGLNESQESMVSEWSEMVREKYFHLDWKEGSLDFLRLAQSYGYPMALATSNDHDLVHDVLSHKGILHCFSSISTSDQVGVAKPEPDVFLEASRQLGVEPERCLVFEDTLSGIEGAQRAGMRAVAVYDAHLGNWNEVSDQSDYHIHSYFQLIERLRGHHE